QQTGKPPMTKKVTLNYDFLAVSIFAFLASCGYNVYQNFQFQELFAEHVDLQWTAQNAEADLVYVRNQLESCKTGPETGI
ncbi:MAG: hypothetical protein KAJ65_03265, partial [Gammaproteobacteria bacterium]|nr:hypothetical protein [Gammaproteobacteria bacterium]